MFIPAKYLLLMTLIYFLNSEFDPLCNNAAINMVTAYIVAFFPCEAADAMESPFAQRNTVASADQRIIRIDAQTKKQISKLLLFGFLKSKKSKKDNPIQNSIVCNWIAFTGQKDTACVLFIDFVLPFEDPRVKKQLLTCIESHSHNTLVVAYYLIPYLNSHLYSDEVRSAITEIADANMLNTIMILIYLDSNTNRKMAYYKILEGSLLLPGCYHIIIFPTVLLCDGLTASQTLRLFNVRKTTCRTIGILYLIYDLYEIYLTLYYQL